MFAREWHLAKYHSAKYSRAKFDALFGEWRSANFDQILIENSSYWVCEIEWRIFRKTLCAGNFWLGEKVWWNRPLEYKESKDATSAFYLVRVCFTGSTLALNSSLVTFLSIVTRDHNSECGLEAVLYVASRNESRSFMLKCGKYY